MGLKLDPIRTMLVVCFTLALAASCTLAAPRLAAQESGTPPETEAPPADAPAPPSDNQQDQNQNPDQQQPNQAQPGPPQNAQPGSVAAAPDMPKWPANQEPNQAKVTWDSHGLSVDASNSSLQQILKDFCTATGAKVDGMNGDERVFGAYGPGRPRDVLSQLLLGAGYNVIMIGDLGQGAPRQILLSERHADDAQTSANRNGANSNNDDDAADNDADDQPQPIQPPRPGFPGGMGRTPQQLMQERQERMQQMQQQIQQRQQQTSPNPQN